MGTRGGGEGAGPVRVSRGRETTAARRPKKEANVEPSDEARNAAKAVSQVTAGTAICAVHLRGAYTHHTGTVNKHLPLNTTTIPVSALFAAGHKWRPVVPAVT